MKHVVLGTAGHVDHGKTALVRALTGVETDRWEEERRRGITIDLGFAPLPLGDGLLASIVDVPGHEDFVRNMVAGATGIDAALLVVAADEGVMPQTVEHVAILELLGVRRGVVALTKADLAEPAWLDLVRTDVADQLAGSPVSWEDPVAVSAVTGAGLDALRARLAAVLADLPARSDADLFRLPVDRAFSVAGAGTVVTGTTWAGTLPVGSEILVLPGGARARVRGVEVHGVPAERAEPGRRTALALAGLDRREVARGQVVVAAGAPWRTTDALDVRLRLLPGARPVGQRSRLRVHLGTAEVLARVTPAEEPVTGGAEGIVRLRLEAPLVARWGDRGVVRAYSPVTTVGGFVVLDPWPPRRPRRPAGAAGLDGPPAERLRRLVARERTAVRVQDLAVRAGLPHATVEAAVRDAGLLVIGDAVYAADRLDALEREALDLLERHHARRPLEPGMPLEDLRRRLGAAALAEAALRRQQEAGAVVVDGTWVRRASHAARLPAALEPAAERVRRALADAGFEGSTAAELAPPSNGMDRETLEGLLEFLVRQGTARRIGRERYYDAGRVEQMIAETRQALREHGQVGPAQLRERLGLTRKFLIPFLEWLDAEQITVRAGDVRRPGPRA